MTAPTTPRPAVRELPSGDWELLDQLSKLRGLLALSIVMTERRNVAEIVHLATTAIPALVPAYSLAVHLPVGDGARWHALREDLDKPAARADLLAKLHRLPRQGGEIEVAGQPWAWAFTLTGPTEHVGTVVVGGVAPLSEPDLKLLRILMQQFGIAIANAHVHTSHQSANEQLMQTVAALRHKTAIHDRFTQVALEGGGFPGIVQALSELTGMPAAILDRSGRIIAAAPEDPPPSGRGFALRREMLRPGALPSGRPVRVGDTLVTAVRPHRDALGILALSDPQGVAGSNEEVALEHGGTVLAIELARIHALTETELRLGRNLMADLLQGQLDDAAGRARALGHDLARPHRVIVIAVPPAKTSDDSTGETEDAILRVREILRGTPAAGDPDQTPLLMQTGHEIVALVRAKALNTELPADLIRELGRRTRIGIGSLCRGAGDIHRSYRDASVSCRLSQNMRNGRGFMRYDELGVYQLLSEVADPKALETFVDTWLRDLISYDATHTSDLVATLAAFLETGGNYDATAEALTIGRSTVRYRIRRVQELTGHDLGLADTRFQLQFAVRALLTRRALADS